MDINLDLSLERLRAGDLAGEIGRDLAAKLSERCIEVAAGFPASTQEQREAILVLVGADCIDTAKRGV